MQVNGDWNPLGDLFYRRSELYRMEWTSEIDLNKCHIVACKFGGPIAIILLDDNIVRQRQATIGTQLFAMGRANFHSQSNCEHVPNFPSKPTIIIYTSSGRRISVGKSKAVDVISIDWTHDQMLIIVTSDASVYLYDVYGILQMEHHLDVKTTENGLVVDCLCITPNDMSTSLALITHKSKSSYKFFICENIPTGKKFSLDGNDQSLNVIKLPDVPAFNANIMFWAAIMNADQQQHTTKNYQINLLVANGPNLYLLEGNGHPTCQFLNLPSSTALIHRIAVSFDASRVALFMDTGQILTITICLENSIGHTVLNFLDFDKKRKKPPNQMLWCGTDAICALWKNELYLIGIDGKECIRHEVEESTYLLGEIDCVRVISNQCHEVLRQVSPVSVEIFRVGTISSSALLVEAYKLYKKESPQAHLNIQSIRERGEMHLAVLSCIEAAGNEYGLDEQKLLIESACFGKKFDPGIAITEYQIMWTKLKVLNTLRREPAFIPMTYCQYEYLTIDIVLNHIMQRGLYSTALWIADWLKLPQSTGESRITAHWAYNLVNKANLEDDYITEEIQRKLGPFPLVSYASVAKQAVDCGRVSLAIKLLNSEPDSSKQIPLLLDLKQYEQVFLSALESYDCNLIYLAIFRLKESLPDENRFVTTLRKHSYAYSLYQKYLSQTDIQQLIMLHYNGKNYQQESRSYFISNKRDQYNYVNNIEMRCISQLDSVARSYRKTKNDFAIQQAEQKLKLYKYQLELKNIGPPPIGLDKLSPDLLRLNNIVHSGPGKGPQSSSTTNKWLNMSLSNTIINLLALKELIRARECQKRFGVAENKFQYLDKIANDRLEPLTLPPAQ